VRDLEVLDRWERVVEVELVVNELRSYPVGTPRSLDEPPPARYA